MQKYTSMQAYKCISGVLHASKGWKIIAFAFFCVGPGRGIRCGWYEGEGPHADPAARVATPVQHLRQDQSCAALHLQPRRYSGYLLVSWQLSVCLQSGNLFNHYVLLYATSKRPWANKKMITGGRVQQSYNCRSRIHLICTWAACDPTSQGVCSLLKKCDPKLSRHHLNFSPLPSNFLESGTSEENLSKLIQHVKIEDEREFILNWKDLGTPIITTVCVSRCSPPGFHFRAEFLLTVQRAVVRSLACSLASQPDGTAPRWKRTICPDGRLS